MTPRFVLAVGLVLVLAGAVAVSGWIGYRATAPEPPKQECWPIGSGQVIPQDVGIACVRADGAMLYWPMKQAH